MQSSLHQNLEIISQMIWKDKLNILYCIACNFETIYSQELIHLICILVIFGIIIYILHITDLGLYVSSDIEQDTNDQDSEKECQNAIQDWPKEA